MIDYGGTGSEHALVQRSECIEFNDGTDDVFTFLCLPRSPDDEIDYSRGILAKGRC